MICFFCMCVGMPNLAALNLEGTGVNDNGVIEYLSTQPKHLQHLNLNRTEVTQAIISHLIGRYPDSNKPSELFHQLLMKNPETPGL